jgi:hypothetical protein
MVDSAASWFIFLCSRFRYWFFIGQPVWIRLAGCLRRTTALCVATRSGVFGFGVLQQRKAAQDETKALFQG